MFNLAFEFLRQRRCTTSRLSPISQIISRPEWKIFINLCLTLMMMGIMILITMIMIMMVMILIMMTMTMNILKIEGPESSGPANDCICPIV